MGHVKEALQNPVQRPAHHVGVEQIFLAQNGLSVSEAMGPHFVTSHREDERVFNLRCVLRFAQRLAHHP